jgi:hypothetical protein
MNHPTSASSLAAADPKTWHQEVWETRYRLPRAAVSWLVVWNVNLGAGGASFSIDNSYYGNHHFIPDAVSLDHGWAFVADDAAPPESWELSPAPVGGFNTLAMHSTGVPMGSGLVLVFASGAPAPGERELALITDAVTARDGAWCPAAVGIADEVRPAISLWFVRGADLLARELADVLPIDAVACVQSFGDEERVQRPFDPRGLVLEHPSGGDRRFCWGQHHCAFVPPPSWALAHRARRLEAGLLPGRPAELPDGLPYPKAPGVDERAPDVPTSARGRAFYIAPPRNRT